MYQSTGCTIAKTSKDSNIPNHPDENSDTPFIKPLTSEPLPSPARHQRQCPRQSRRHPPMPRCRPGVLV